MPSNAQSDQGGKHSPTRVGKYGDTIIIPSELSHGYEEIDDAGDVKAKIWEDSGTRKVYIRVRDHEDGRKFNEFSIPLGDGGE